MFECSSGSECRPHDSYPKGGLKGSPFKLRWPNVHQVKKWLILIQFGFAILAGCDSNGITPTQTSPRFSVALSSNPTDVKQFEQDRIDTNCTGCNSIDESGRPVQQFVAMFATGGVAPVVWSVSGGDPVAGPGAISEDGQYTPPAYLTLDRVRVVLTASLKLNLSSSESSVIWVTPGFLQPLTPENAAVGANGIVNITGYLAQVGGATDMSYAIVGSPAEDARNLGSLSDSTCKRGNNVFTSCFVTYHAPPAIGADRVVNVSAVVRPLAARITTRILLNAAGISSNPASHQTPFASNMQLGTSGGNNSDYDAMHGRVIDCCGGTLGALLKDTDNREYVLSNNHVFARSDHALGGDPIVQPGLIDNNCAPSSLDSGSPPIASLTEWLPLNRKETNVDAAIAEVRSSAIDLNGSILEMGSKQPDGSLASAPPGISSSGGKGEAGTLQMKVAKSGRTTGQTCAAITAVDVDVNVDYYTDCAETKHYLNKTFTHQLAISGDGFSDAGDSGSLVLDARNAEPVGLYFAGSVDSLGVSQAMVNPASDLLNELSAQAGGGITYTYVGSQDHPVSCLNYGDSTILAVRNQTMSDAEIKRAQGAVEDGRMLVNPAAGVLGVAAGRSYDRPGEAALVVYLDPNSTAKVPAVLNGIRTVVVANNEQVEGVAETAPLGSFMTPSPPTSLSAAIAIKEQYAPALMRHNPAFFAVGVGQSLDNPREAALMIYVDRRFSPGELPQNIGGLRTRYVVMDRFHVTRSYATPAPATLHCSPQR